MAAQTKGFDIPGLIKLGFLDIRKVAQKNLFLTVGDYFALLYRFKSEGPRASEALGEISCGTADRSYLRTVQDLQDLLEEIGVKRMTLVLADIIGAIKKNNLDLAIDCAKSIYDQFIDMYNKILATEVSESHAEFFTSGDNTNVIETVPFSAQTLIKYLDKLEREENDRKLRILAVDDSASMLKTISATLSFDYKVYAMTNPMMLEKFLEQITPELFLLDYKMPERSGFECIPIIRSFEEHKKTPIIMLTAMGSVDHISASHSLGACDFIVKPFDEDVLRKKVAKHIIKKKLF